MLLPAGGDGGEEDHVLDGPRFGGVGDLLAERCVDIRGQPGLLQNFPGGGFRLRLVSLHMALGEAPVPAVMPDQKILPLSGLPPPDHRAAGFFFQSLPEDAAVSPGPLPAVGAQIEVPLGNAQIHQGEGPRAAEPHPDGAVRTAGKPVALPVHGGGGPPDGLHPGLEPVRDVFRFRGQLLQRLQGTARCRALRMVGGAYGDDAYQFFLRGETGGAALFVIGAAYPAGCQSHGLGGEDQLLAVEAALFFQILISGGTREEEIIACPLDAPPALQEGREGLRFVTHQL